VCPGKARRRFPLSLSCRRGGHRCGLTASCFPSGLNACAWRSSGDHGFPFLSFSKPLSAEPVCEKRRALVADFRFAREVESRNFSSRGKSASEYLKDTDRRGSARHRISCPRGAVCGTSGVYPSPLPEEREFLEFGGFLFFFFSTMALFFFSSSRDMRKLNFVMLDRFAVERQFVFEQEVQAPHSGKVGASGG